MTIVLVLARSRIIFQFPDLPPSFRGAREASEPGTSSALNLSIAGRDQRASEEQQQPPKESVMVRNNLPELGLASLWQGMIRDLFGAYRPERHYMRGPGPAYRAKQMGA
jgi:hypothetical protein